MHMELYCTVQDTVGTDAYLCKPARGLYKNPNEMRLPLAMSKHLVTSRPSRRLALPPKGLRYPPRGLYP